VAPGLCFLFSQHPEPHPNFSRVSFGVPKCSVRMVQAAGVATCISNVLRKLLTSTSAGPPQPLTHSLSKITVPLPCGTTASRSHSPSFRDDSRFWHARTIHTKIRGVTKTNPDGTDRQEIISKWCGCGRRGPSMEPGGTNNARKH
jgi:hypothetical protein